ncbi:MAG: patatin-like phospholipase family protein [Candidatus Pacearchaeota archaeon]
MAITPNNLFVKKKNLALVLSGGAVRGFAHIGVLDVLDENKIPIDVIVGTSMGSIVGGIYACGKLKEFEQDIIKQSESKLRALFWNLKFKKPGSDSEKLFGKFLYKYIGKKKIEDLGIDFTAIATDLKTGKEVYINKGSLLKAVLASSCLPGLCNPVEIGNKLLIDGGVVDPLPQSYGMTKANKVIAVNAMPKKYVYKKNLSFYNVLLNASSIMSNALVNLEKTLSISQLQKDKIIFIQLPTEKRDAFDFYKIEELIKIGRRTAKAYIKKIIELVHD